MTESRPRPNAQVTRERMLCAATARFARQSYGHTGLREIAADAGVDVAHLHRSFGSKERLFAEVLRLAIADARIVPAEAVPPSADPAATSAFLIGRVLEVAEGGETPTAIALIAHSLSCPEALPLVRTTIEEMFSGPLTAQLGPDYEGRVALLTALFIGLAIGKSVIGLEGLGEPHREELRPVVAGLIRDVLTLDGRGAGQPSA